MPALMPQRPSSALNKIRRELERRRTAINVVKGGVVKKSSAVPVPRPPPSVSSAGAATLKLANAPREGVAKKPSSAPLPHRRVLIPVGPPGAATGKITYLDMGEAPRRCTAPRRIPFAMKVGTPNKPTATTAHEAAAEKLSSHETAGAGTEYIKTPSSVPIQQPRSSSISVKKGMVVKVRAPARALSTGQRIVIVHPAVVVSDVEDGYLEVVYSGYPRDRTMRIALDQVKRKNMPSTK